MPEGFSFNSNGADGRSRVPTPRRGSAPRQPPNARSSRRSARSSSKAGHFPVPIDGYAYLGEPKPNDPYRVTLTADGFATHVKLAGSTHAEPGHGSSDDLAGKPPADAVLPVQAAPLRLRAWDLRDPRKVRGSFAVESTFVPWASEISNQTSTQFFELNTGPNGSSARAARARSRRRSTAARPTTRPAPTRASASSLHVRRGTEPAGLEVSVPRGLTATLKGVPDCPESAIAALQQRRLPRGDGA